MFLPDPACEGEAIRNPVTRPAGRDVYPPSDGDGLHPTESIRPAALPAGTLEATERRVVRLSHGDARRFGWEGHRKSRMARGAARLLRAITGVEPVQALADARLERLRLFACMMRRGDARAGPTATMLLADGFSEAALREAVGLALA